MLNRILLSPDAAAPAAPATPEAPAKPAAAPSPAAAAPAADPNAEPNPFDALDGMIAKNRGKEPPKPEGDDKDKGDLRDKTKDNPPPKEPAAPDPKAAVAQGPKALREQLEKTNGELKTFREKATTLEAKIAEYEKRGKDNSALAERLQTVEKALEAKESDLRRIKREASPEFKEKYDVPYRRAADVAESFVKQLKILGEKRKTDDVTGVETVTMEPIRDATFDDFVRIYRMPWGQAQDEAEKLFGKSERVIMNHYERLHALEEEKNLALKEVRDNWEKVENEEKAAVALKEAQREKTMEEIQNAWCAVNTEILEKNPELYGAKPDDKEEAAILAKAYETWEAKPKTWKGQVIKDAMIRNRLAASYLQEHRMAKLADRVAELEAALAATKGSKPGSTKTPGGTEKAGEKPWDEDLRESVA